MALSFGIAVRALPEVLGNLRPEVEHLVHQLGHFLARDLAEHCVPSHAVVDAAHFVENLSDLPEDQAL